MPALERGGREADLKLVVVELVRERPAQTGRLAPFEVATDRGSGQPDRDPDLARAQAPGKVEPQDFSDLAHSNTGTGHRHLSSNVVAFEQSVRCPACLTPTLLARSPRGVANSRETGWPIRVKQGGR